MRHKHLDSSHNRSIDWLVFVWEVSENPDTVLKGSVLQACGFPAEKCFTKQPVSARAENSNSQAEL